MRKPKLKIEIMKTLVEKTRGEISKRGIRNALSRIRRDAPFLTLNAAAEVFAKKRGFSVARYLDLEDREALKSVQLVKVSVQKAAHRRKPRTIEIAKYDTEDKLLKMNVDEINKTYTYGCYTATFVLCRKVIENLTIHRILMKKFPGNRKEDREKYFDFSKGRFLDFETLLKNLRNCGKDFGPDKGLVERICQLAGRFKETANEMTHSLYHVATKKEIDECSFQHILDLVKRLEKALEAQK